MYYYYTVGTFTVPLFSGTPPPPIAWFTLDNLQLQNKAIMFGGAVAVGNRVYCTNDCYILTMSNHQVVCNYTQLIENIATSILYLFL